MQSEPATQSSIPADVVCDVCLCSTRIGEYGSQYGTLRALWGKGSHHEGEYYQAHLCESCFFSVIGNLRRERMVSTMFDVEQHNFETFGLLTGDDWLVVRERAEQVFDDKGAAITWLESPNMALDGQSPLDRYKTPEGRKEVLRILSAIEHGNPV